jgi:DNA-binding PadR family transcriptional regulator
LTYQQEPLADSPRRDIMEITEASKNLLVKIVNIGNQFSSDCPWHEWMDEPFTQQEKGNLSDLVKKGFIKVGQDDGQVYYEISPEAFDLVENITTEVK